MKPMKPISIDFDGVLHEFKDGWTGDYPTGKPIKDARWAMEKLKEKEFRLIVFTARKDLKYVFSWLKDNNIPFDEVTNTKPHALAYIDDRGIRFTNWQDMVKYFI